VQGDRVDRLDQMVVEARRARPLPILGLAVTGERHQAHAAQLRRGADGARDVVAIDVRQADVEQHHVRAQRVHALQGIARVIAEVDGVPLESQQHRE